MSVRAYRLIEVKHAEAPTFNCWSDDKIMSLANDMDSYSENGGELSFEKKVLRDELEEMLAVKPDEKRINDPEYIATLRDMIKDCGDDDFVTYYCF